MMKIVIAKGGLGNTMFQYALVISLRNDVRTKEGSTIFFVSRGNLDEHNGYELANIFSNIRTLDIKKGYLWQNLYCLVLMFFKRIRHHRVKYILYEKLFRNYVGITECKEDADYVFNVKSKNVYYDGYFQNYHIFDKYRGLLLNVFKFDMGKISEKSRETFSHIVQTQSVSIHLRRGDYLSKKISNIFHTCTPDYYSNAIAYINNKVNEAQFYVFSDDVNYAKSLFKGDCFTFVDHNHGKDSWQDMFLMSQCKHNIIANSTFSWWGAWLNANLSKIVIAPKEWFINDEAKELIPDDWIRM